MRNDSDKSRKHSVRKTVTKLNPDEIKEENPQCKKRTTTSDEGQCTSNSNTHHNGDKNSKNFTQLY